MRERRCVARLQIPQQKRRGFLRDLQILAPEPAQRRDLKVLQQPFARSHLKRALARQRRHEPAARPREQAAEVRLDLGNKALCRAQALDFSQRRSEMPLPAKLRHEKLARRDIRHRQPACFLRGAHGREKVVRGLLQQMVFEHSARRNDARHLAPHDALRLFRVLHLIADRHPQPRRQQPRYVAVHRMVGHAAHGGLILIAAGQHDLEDWGGLHRVLAEHLVEVAHPEHHEHVRVLLLDGGILPLHGSQLRRRGSGGHIEEGELFVRRRHGR